MFEVQSQNCRGFNVQ